MDRKLMLVQRTRECFGDRLEDVRHMVREDRQAMRGWEEPAHVRAAARRAVREGGTSEEQAAVAVVEVEFSRPAAEPDRGQQREAVGQVLEAGANALDKIAREPSPDLRPEEVLGLECVLLLYGRPAVLIDQGRMGQAPPFWNVLEDQREEVELAARGVGRIELFGHPEYDWAGTGALVGETTLLTSRRVAETFAERRQDRWQFRPGITAWMDYRSPYQQVASAGYRIRSVIGVHDVYDLAVLEVEPPQGNGKGPMPLALSAQEPPRLEGRPAYLIGYPVRDARRNEPERVARIFRDVYNVKRVQPGQLRGLLRFENVQLLRHDCAPLGQTTGSPVLDLETHQVVGLQLGGRYLQESTAIPTWVLRDDPLLRRAGVT
ncbi:MAG TPA: serine protease, partial [Gemmataceae bacterium]|nr:serine protease [Gemmataceae bacterium]